LDAALQQVRKDIDWVSFWPDKGAIDAACGDNAAVSIHSAALGLDGETIELTAAGEDYAFSSKVFFQGNKFLIDALIDAAIGDAAGKTALDLYSGVGLFTLQLARRFQRVISVEEFAPAIEFARKNVAKGGHQNVDIVRKPVGRYLAEQRKLTIDFALLDPPRAGTEKKTVLDLIRLRPRHVSYVSCDPSVLARDLRRFLDAGYQIDSITALDLFPQTHHVETIVRLREQ
jgi:23S rRNA (uracil1939-C5)-methyltransferase